MAHIIKDDGNKLSIGFSPSEKDKALSYFVTSTEDRIYAIKNVPPEVFGAFGSFFSRNPEDMREHLWNAIVGRIPGYELSAEQGLQNLEGLLRGDFDPPHKAIASGLAKSQAFFKEWYGQYSHKSIANTVWLPMVATNVSQLFARQLAYEQLAFFIEQSTRFCEFDGGNFYRDPKIMDSEYGELYEKTLSRIGKIYPEFAEYARQHYRDAIPFDHWKEWQTSETLSKSEGFQKRKYEREINGAAMDIARFLLPQAIKTNIAWILDARSTEFNISSWKESPLSEIRVAAGLIERHAGQVAPSLLKYTEGSTYYGDKLNNYGGDFQLEVESIELDKIVNLLQVPDNALDFMLSTVMKSANRGGTFSQYSQHIETLSFEDKIKILRRMVKDRGPWDEWVALEEFDIPKVVFELVTDLGAIRDWRRHQKWDRTEPSYTMQHGVYRPEVVDEISGNGSRLWDEAMNLSHHLESALRTDFPDEAQYAVPMAAWHSIIMSGGFDQLQYLLNTRSTPQGNFSYREDSFNIAEEFCRRFPWIIGLEEYPEGMGFLEVYKSAPFQDLLRLQLGSTALHQ